MSKTHRFFTALLCATALLAMAGVAVAQNSSAQKPPAKSGQKNVKVTHHQDWDVRCPKSGKKSQCEMTQLVKNPNNDKPIMRVVMGYPKQIDGPAMIFILPLGTRLAPGVQFSVDGSQAKRFPFQICLKQGCRADYPIKSGLLNKLKHGRKAQVSIVGPKGKQINLKISLLGFTASNKAIAP